MPTVLVLANETLSGRTLLDALRERHERDADTKFVVVAPLARPKSGLVVLREAAESATQMRIDEMLEDMRAAGLTATGEVMDPDPFNAAMDAVREYDPDEIIISTHPDSRSGWLRRDLVERVQLGSGIPVEHVVVDLDAEREDVTHTLVIANQTVGGAPLLGLLAGKAKEKPRRFIVVVPQANGGGQASIDANTRLDEVLSQMTASGLQAHGAIGDSDPYIAIQNALRFYSVDEIVISTLPEMRSGWLRSDLIDRVKRSTAKPVEHVVVDAPEASGPAPARR